MIQRFGGLTAPGLVVWVVLGGSAACGADFGDDCRESRTCASPEPPSGPGQAGEAGSGAAGAGEAGAGEATSAAGGASEGGSSGMLAECSVAAECSNGDASDGEEACRDGMCTAGNAPPFVVSVVPTDGAVEVAPDGSIVIEFSEPLDEATVTPASVRVFDGDDPVPGKLDVAGSEVTFRPDARLGLLAPYVVSVSTAVADAEGATLDEDFGSSFTVRDGEWSVSTVVPGDIAEMSPTVGLNAAGQALLAWSAKGAANACPATVRWFDRGVGLGSNKTFSHGREQYCLTVRSAVSTNGLALLSWYEEDNQGSSMVTVDFRDGKWGATSSRSNRNDYQGAVAVAEDGTMHLFGAGSDVQVWRTTPAGVWPATGQVLATLTPRQDPKVAVARNGDAIAAWRDRESDGRLKVVVARYSNQTKTWSSATTLPGGLGTSASSLRGEPQVAFDDANQPVAIWQRESKIVASRYDAAQSAWSGPVSISAEVGGFPQLQHHPEPPALAFDGRTFVAAFTALADGVLGTYVVRYDRENDEWKAPELVNDRVTVATSRMPRLSADARGNLLVVWATPGDISHAYDLVYQRFDAAAGAWLGPQPIVGATMTNSTLQDGLGRYALGGNASGLAALGFSNHSPTGPSKLRLASFY